MYTSLNGLDLIAANSCRSLDTSGSVLSAENCFDLVYDVADGYSSRVIQHTAFQRVTSFHHVRVVIVPPSDLANGPLITPHHPLVVRLSQLTELLHKFVHFLAARGRRCRFRRRRSHEAGCEALREVVLRRRCVSEAHEEELRREPL